MNRGGRGVRAVVRAGARCARCCGAALAVPALFCPPTAVSGAAVALRAD